jgi:hypothetical protein
MNVSDDDAGCKSTCNSDDDASCRIDGVEVAISKPYLMISQVDAN